MQFIILGIVEVRENFKKINVVSKETVGDN